MSSAEPRAGGASTRAAVGGAPPRLSRSAALSSSSHGPRRALARRSPEPSPTEQGTSVSLVRFFAVPSVPLLWQISSQRPLDALFLALGDSNV